MKGFKISGIWNFFLSKKLLTFFASGALCTIIWIGITGPEHVEHQAAQLILRNHESLAALVADRIETRLESIQQRFSDTNDPRLSGLMAARSEFEYHQALTKLHHPSDVENGIMLLVHDLHGAVLASDPSLPPEATLAMRHHQHVNKGKQWTTGLGFCEKCFHSMNVVSMALDLDEQRFLSVNIDIEKLGGDVLSKTLTDREMHAWIADLKGMLLLQKGEGDFHHGMPAGKARVGMSDLTVTVGAPLHHVAPGVGSLTRLFLMSCIVASVMVVLLMGGLAKLERRRLKQEYEALDLLSRQDRLATLGLLSASVAHEINNSLMVANFALESLKASCPTNSEDCAGLAEGLNRLGRLSHDLTHSTHADLLSEFKANSVIEEAIRITSPKLKHGPSLQPYLSQDIQMKGYPHAIVQVLVNLILNASHVSSKKDAILISMERWGERVVYRVDDQGPGIPAHLTEKIFEPLFTTKGEEGTGFGLWLSRRIAKRQGGNLSVRNLENGGASFRLEVPIHIKESEPELSTQRKMDVIS